MPTVIGAKREGGARARQGSDGLVTYEEDVHYLVRADYAGQPKVNIVTDTAGLPKVNQSFIGSLMCSSVDAKMKDGNATLFDVTATFSSQVAENVDPSTPQQGEPTVWTPVADVVFEPYTEVARKDVNGTAWVNSANKPFEVGLELPRRIAAATFTQFESLASVSVEQIMENRCDKVNVSSYKGFSARSLLLTVDRATIGFFYGVRCWRIQYTIKYKKQNPLPSQANTGGWTLQQLDAGWHYYDSSNNLQPFLDDTGGQFIGLLDGEGGKLADQQNDDPVYLPFDIYEPISFSFLRW